MKVANKTVRRLSAVLLSVAAVAVAGEASAQQDPRVALKAGWTDAGVAAKNIELVSNVSRPAGFFNPQSLGDILLANSDLAFRGNDLFLGNFHGIQIYDISDPRNPKLRKALPCPGGQGDVSIYGNLLFMSVEMPNGRIDCGQGDFNQGTSKDRFLGVRIFDITDLNNPKQVASVQTCRGSHTHTLVPDPKDPAHIYVYVSGTSNVRPAAELAGCSGLPPEQDPNTSYFRIEVIKVPVAAPQQATIVNTPRIFADAQGNIAGLSKGGTHPSGRDQTARTDQCHDITVYPEIGLAGGACAGNGILLDISDPANPKRIAEVSDPNFAYWHSATFNNDGTKVLFTDEWGGGVQARCRSSDRPEWGADAIFTLENRQLKHEGYFKLPAAQGANENCVAHNGSLIPVPGRDIMVQSWYQGGLSIFDFTDPKKPVEIAYFDRGPLSSNELMLGGYWSTYWYNGRIYGSEIGRGLDVLELKPSEHLSQNEIDAAKLVRVDVLNPQTQKKIVWPAQISVARAYVDQLKCSNTLGAPRLSALESGLDRADSLTDAAAKRAALTQLADTAKQLSNNAQAADAKRLNALAQTLTDLAK